MAVNPRMTWARQAGQRAALACLPAPVAASIHPARSSRSTSQLGIVTLCEVLDSGRGSV
jgi:hypothetical protein